MRSITQVEIEHLIYEAKQSPRKRAILRLHEHEEPVQRMINALIPGTYITPHKHERPDKVELFSILMGKIAVVEFDERGEVINIVRLSTDGKNKIVDIPPRTYHTLIPLQASAALEIIQGPYDALTHKKFAPWALPEDNPKAADYLMYLTSIVDNWRS